MSRKLVVLEPSGYYELDATNFVAPGDKYITYLLVSGVSEIPVPEYSDIDTNVEEDMHTSNEEFCEIAIEWYKERGFVAEVVEVAGMVGYLG